MKRVYSAPNGVLVHNLKNALASRGVPCEVRGEARFGAIGELPPIECWPELWVLDDDRVDEAEQVVAAAMEETREDIPSWPCPQCRETIEGTFDVCWKCGAGRETESDS